MAYKSFDGISAETGNNTSNDIRIQAEGAEVQVPDIAFVKDATITRDGADLILDTAQGKLIVEEYYNTETTPNIVSPDGSTLTPQLVESFSTSTPRYASADASMSDESPIGAVNELSGDATITRTDGTTEPLTIGTPVFQGDVIETAGNGAANIVFVDETSFAVSEDTRLAIDEYVFDPSTNAGTTNFSVLKGMFVFTSGLIGREDPDDVQIETPVGSIGIRGTIIAGNVDSGEITVVEGAIVLNDFQGNEVTLANQFETAQFGSNGQGIQHIGQLAANDVAGRFSGVSRVAPDLFSSINDAANEAGDEAQGEQQAQDGEEAVQQTDEQESAPEEAAAPEGEQTQGETEAQAANEEQTAEEQAADEAQNGEDQSTEEQAAADDTAEQAEQKDAKEAEPQGEAKEQQQDAKENAPEAGADEAPQQGQEPSADQPAADAAQGQQQGQSAPEAPAPAQQIGQNTLGEVGVNAGQAIGEAALNASLGNADGVAAKAESRQGNPNNQGQNQNPATEGGPNGPLPIEVLDKLKEKNGRPTEKEEEEDASNTTAAGDTSAGSNAPTISTNTTVESTAENVSGAHVATIQGTSAVDLITSITLEQAANNYFEVYETATGIWEVYLKSGETLDYEDTYPDIEYTATGANGATYDGSFTLDITDEDEGIHHYYAEGHREATSGVGQTYTHDFSQDFHHEDNTPLTYNVTNITVNIDIDGDNNIGALSSSTYSESAIGIDLDADGSLSSSVYATSETFTFTNMADLQAELINYIDTLNYDPATGYLDITFKNTFTNDINIEFDITATDGNTSHDLTKTYEIDVFTANTDYSSSAAAEVGSISGTHETTIGSIYGDEFTINTGSEHSKVFAGDGNDTLRVYGHHNTVYGQEGSDILQLKNSASAYENILHGGAGDDYFEISFNASAKDNLLIGGHGDDIFEIENVNNKFLGGEGDDTFKINLDGHNNALVDLQSNVTNRAFDGNEGFNTLQIEGGSALTLAQRTLDFTHIEVQNGGSTSFHNISRIDLTDTAQQKVVLKASDVFQITGGDNTLVIDGHNYAGATDILEFNNDSGKNFVYERTEYHDYDGDNIYDDHMRVYSNGDVTILIDQAINVNGTTGGGIT